AESFPRFCAMASVARRVAALIADFVDWWLGELWGLVPSVLRRGLTRSRQRIVVVLGTDVATVQVEINGTRSTLERLSLDDEAGAATALAALLEGSGLAQRLR